MSSQKLKQTSNMATGVYKRTKYHLEILRNNALGNKSPSQFKKGHEGYWKGKKQPKAMIEKNAKLRTGKLNWKYRGDDGFKKKIKNYGLLHAWIKRELGKPMQCSNCKTKRKTQYDWANRSHKYKKVISDWIRLCAKCHIEYDIGKIKI